MRLVLLGAPGVGKGVQGNLLKERYNVPKISTGDILREAMNNNTSEGKEAEAFLRSGKLVPDFLINSIVEKRLKNDDCRDGFILDGYPRTVPQAEFLNEMLLKNGNTLDKVINVEVDKDIIIERLSNRRICLSCGELYNMLTDPPPGNGLCKICGGKVIQREDDKPETIKKRIEVHKKETQPLKEFYESSGLLVELDGNNDIMNIHRNIISLIE